MHASLRLGIRSTEVLFFLSNGDRHARFVSDGFQHGLLWVLAMRRGNADGGVQVSVRLVCGLVGWLVGKLSNCRRRTLPNLAELQLLYWGRYGLFSIHFSNDVVLVLSTIYDAIP